MIDPIEQVVDMYIEEGMTEREAIYQVKEDALKGRDIRRKEEGKYCE